MWRQRAAGFIHVLSGLLLKVDAPTRFFPIAVARRIGAVSATNFLRRFNTLATDLRAIIHVVGLIGCGVFTGFIFIVGHSGSMPDCVGLC